LICSGVESLDDSLDIDLVARLVGGSSGNAGRRADRSFGGGAGLNSLTTGWRRRLFKMDLAEKEEKKWLAVRTRGTMARRDGGSRSEGRDGGTAGILYLVFTTKGEELGGEVGAED
jgi:hypothetical protein